MAKPIAEMQMASTGNRIQTCLHTLLGACRAIGLSAATCVILAGCGVPEHMEVRGGKDPRGQDDDVRFRTTYYFRVFDTCRRPAELHLPTRQQAVIPLTDSLYRFRVTGKANSLTTKVHFEAGTLKSYEIDPFGANVVFDEKNDRFHFKSRRQIEEEGAREANYREIRRLMDLYSEFGGSEGASPDVGGDIQRLIRIKLEQLEGGASNPGVVPTPFTPENKIEEFKVLAEQYKTIAGGDNANAKERLKTDLEENLGQLFRAVAWKVHQEEAIGEANASGNWRKYSVELYALRQTYSSDQDIRALTEQAAGKLAVAEAYSPASSRSIRPEGSWDAGQTAQGCPVGSVLRRGFQILGPEGWRTFNQDDRLVVAMSSSGKPLISALKDLSARVLNEQGSREALLLPLVEERLSISKALRRLDSLDSPGPSPDAPATELEGYVQSVIDVFDEARDETN